MITEINDIRDKKKFVGITFSKFKKREVIQKMYSAIQKTKIEDACYWCAELVCAGHHEDIWDIFISFLANNIDTENNPSICKYLLTRFHLYEELRRDALLEISIRNIPRIRHLYAEITSVLSQLNKTCSIERIPKLIEEDYEPQTIITKIKADSDHYGKTIIRQKDPTELLIPINEIIFYINNSNTNHTPHTNPNTNIILYWMEWILGYEKIQKTKIIPRDNVLIEPKYRNDYIWLIWEIINNNNSTNNNSTNTNINNMYEIFCIYYKSSKVKDRIQFLYKIFKNIHINAHNSAPSYTSYSAPPTPLLNTEEKEQVKLAVERIDCIYQQIKTNEESANLNYLYYNQQK